MQLFLAENRLKCWSDPFQMQVTTAKECSIQQRRGFACGVCRWKRRFGCSRNSAVSAARFESGFRERDGQGQHWRGPHSHGDFLKMIVCESGGHANGLTYFIFRFLRRPLSGARSADGSGGDAALLPCAGHRAREPDRGHRGLHVQPRGGAAADLDAASADQPTRLGCSRNRAASMGLWWRQSAAGTLRATRG